MWYWYQFTTKINMQKNITRRLLEILNLSRIFIPMINNILAINNMTVQTIPLMRGTILQAVNNKVVP
jgi:hypothetical protein